MLGRWSLGLGMMEMGREGIFDGFVGGEGADGKGVLLEGVLEADVRGLDVACK